MPMKITAHTSMGKERTIRFGGMQLALLSMTTATICGALSGCGPGQNTEMTVNATAGPPGNGTEAPAPTNTPNATFQVLPTPRYTPIPRTSASPENSGDSTSGSSRPGTSVNSSSATGGSSTTSNGTGDTSRPRTPREGTTADSMLSSPGGSGAR